MLLSLDDIKKTAQQSDALRARAEHLLTSMIRDAARAGFSQREIAHATGRSQPEISRLLRFRGTTPLAKQVRKSRPALLAIAREFGLENLEVFGSVARGTDHAHSDVDLLYTSNQRHTLFTLAAAEAAMSAELGVRVDLVERKNLKPHVSATALQEAIPL